MQIAFKSDIGQRRDSNQDYVQAFNNKTGVVLSVIADGMGGHRAGDVASDMVVTHLGEEFEKNDSSDIRSIAKWMQKMLIVENKRVVAASKKESDLEGMGTTIVAAFIFPQEPSKLLVVNVGDSRCYLYRDNKLKQLSFDHSLVNELFVSGEITAQQAKDYPNKNIITQSLGVSDSVQPTFGEFKIKSKDQILLCTDGLTNMVSEAEISEILGSKLTVQEKCQQLIDHANAAGGIDNITVQIIDLSANNTEGSKND